VGQQHERASLDALTSTPSILRNARISGHQRTRDSPLQHVPAVTACASKCRHADARRHAWHAAVRSDFVLPRATLWKADRTCLVHLETGKVMARNCISFRSTTKLLTCLKSPALSTHAVVRFAVMKTSRE
jgi:hypothetical protein